MASGDDLRDRLKGGNYSKWSPASQQPVVGQRYNLQSLEKNPPLAKPGRRKLYMALLVFIVAGSLGTTYYLTQMRNSPIPASVQSAVSLPLYYPAKLPEGFGLDVNSYSVSGEIVSFHAVNKQNHKLIFNIQPRPPTFDFPAFYQKGLSGTEQFTTPVGQAAIGKAQTKLIGSLVTETSWIIISSDSDEINSDDLRLTLNNLRRAQ